MTDATDRSDALTARIGAARSALPSHVQITEDGAVEPVDAEESPVRWVPLVERDRLDISGRDRAKFLQGLVTNDVKALTSGAGCHSALLTVKGKFQVEFGVSAGEDHFLVDTPAGFGGFLASSLDRYLFRDKVTFDDRASTALASVVWGDADALDAVLGVAPGAAPWSRARTTIGGADAELVRDPWTGGVRVWLDAAELEQVWATWAADERMALASTGDVHAARIERGLPIFPIDVGTENIALEASGLELVSFTKGCYLGQEVIARVDSRGAVNKHVVPLRFDGAPAPFGTTLVAPDDHERAGRTLGTVTSVAQVGADLLGIGTVRRGFEAPGTRLPLHDDTGEVVGHAVVRASKA